jgi:hypothetical protein
MTKEDTVSISQYAAATADTGGVSRTWDGTYLAPASDRELLRLWRQHHPKRGILQRGNRPPGRILAVACRRASDRAGVECDRLVYFSHSAMYAYEGYAAAHERFMIAVRHLVFILNACRQDVPRELAITLVAIECERDGRYENLTLVEHAPITGLYPGPGAHWLLTERLRPPSQLLYLD